MELEKSEVRKMKVLYYSDGKIFITRKAERMVYFLLMLVMACSGILIKLGIL